MCFLTARPPCGVSSLTQLWPRSTWWKPRLSLKSPLLSRLLNQSFCPDRWTWWGKPKDSGFIDKATSKQLAISPSSPLLRENRHFVIPAALNATDTEACPGLCNHSLLFQQHGNKLTKLQIRVSSEIASRHNKVVTTGATQFWQRVAQKE